MVHYLWSERQEIFFYAGFRVKPRPTENKGSLRTFLRLFRFWQRVESRLLLTHNFRKFINIVRHCFERTIAGRPQAIEVSWVAEKRWRAHIARIPGIPTAMMPFYGETPDEAATNLADWLNRAHRH